MDLPSSVSEDNALGDRELVSLYMKYPELNLDFDDEDLIQQEAEQSSDFFSSPTTSSTQVSGSTTRTTPLRPDPFAFITTPSNDYEDLEHLLRESELPDTTYTHFISLANHSLQIGGQLFQPYAAVTGQENAQQVAYHCQALSTSLNRSRQKVDEQLANIAYIKTLAPFIVKPGTEDLLPVYCQRVELIIKYVELPSKVERDVLESIARVYDAYVYNPALVASRNNGLDLDLVNTLNSLYDLHMTLLGKYKQWCRAMTGLKNSHIKPVMARIISSPTITRGLWEIEEMRAAAKVSILDRSAVGLQPVDEKLVEALRLNARRKILRASRIKTRFRREHTV